MGLENQSTKVVKNFSGITSMEELTAQLDITFSRLFDLLDAKAQNIPLLDNNKVVPKHKAGDLVLDYRDGIVRPMMSDGKALQPFHHDHGAQPSQVDDGTGTGGTVNAHELATKTKDGFMPAAVMADLHDINVQLNGSLYYLHMTIAGVDHHINANFTT